MKTLYYVKSILYELYTIFSCYPNTFFDGIKYLLRTIYWYLWIKPFWKETFIWEYLFGIKMVFNKKMDGCRYAYLLPRLDYFAKYIIREYITPQSTLIDIWSNIGQFALIGGSKKAFVYCFEPNSTTNILLKQNLEINNFDANKFVINETLVGNKNWIQKFYNYGNSLTGLWTTISPRNNKDITEEKKKVTTLDSFVEKNIIQEIHFLKIDAEGAEKMIFEGMSQILEKQIVHTIFWETNTRFKDQNTNHIMNLLSSHNYTHFYFEEKNRILIPWEKHFCDCLSIRRDKINIIQSILHDNMLTWK